MSMFPTTVALKRAKDAGLGKLLTTELHLNEAIADFQKVATTGDFEDALIMFEAHVVKGKLTEKHKEALNKIFDFTQVEINGIIFDSVGSVMRGSSVEANKLAAAKLAHEIRNSDVEEDGSNKTVKRIIFEMSKATGE